MVRALQVGAKRGVNVAFVGKGGAGKSMLLEPFAQIFAIAGKPQKGSSFPLANVLNADLILWQDYKHHEATLSYTDLLSLLVGENVDIRIPGEVGVPYRNRAPAFYTGRAPIAFTSADPQEKADYDSMMMERFATFHFNRGLPKEEREAAFPQCGRCCAAFFLQQSGGAAGSGGATSAPQSSGGSVGSAPLLSAPAPAPAAAQAASAGDAMMAALREAGQMHASGVLNAAEFAAAKRRILGE